MGYTLPPPPALPYNEALSQVQSFIARKSEIEAELQEHLTTLRSQNADMSTPLVDRAGFPRADLDIVAIRTARVRIIALRNDLNAVLEQVKVGLEKVHQANAASSASREDRSEGDATDRDGNDAQLTPFARVDGVAPGSPAADAGLQREDLILAFGSLTLSGLSASIPATAPSRLAPLATLASSHEGRPLQLKILRASEQLTLTLVPHKWGGRGLIGCHIVPYSGPA